MNNKLAIIIFSKTPVVGQVKTRLIPELGEQKALDIYIELLSHTVETMVSSGLGDVYMYATPTVEHALFEQYQQQYELQLRQQQGKDLGARMYNAINTTLQDYDSCILIGCDCPEITNDLLQQTINELQTTDLVLGPTHDGGYYLIAANKIDQQLFDNIQWGTDTVLSETRHRLQQLGYQWSELITLSDIDTYDDLMQMKSIPWIVALNDS